MTKNSTAIILAGGKSLRIGKDKSFLKIGGITLIERTHNLLKEKFDKIIIISNNPGKYVFLTSKVYQDVYPGFGPLSGIHSGLINSKTQNNFIVSCDMPFVNNAVIDFILAQNYFTNKEITITKSNSDIHSLCGIYNKSCIPTLENLLEKAKNELPKRNKKVEVKLFDLIDSVDSEIMEITNEDFCHPNLMFNMNSVEDYEFVKNEYRVIKKQKL